MIRRVQQLEVKGFNIEQTAEKLGLSIGQVCTYRAQAYEQYVKRNSRKRENQIYLHEMRLTYLFNDYLKQYQLSKHKEINCPACKNEDGKREACQECNHTGKTHKRQPGSARLGELILNAMGEIAKLHGLNAPTKIAALSSQVPWEEIVGMVQGEPAQQEALPTPEQYFAKLIAQKKRENTKRNAADAIDREEGADEKFTQILPDGTENVIPLDTVDESCDNLDVDEDNA